MFSLQSLISNAKRVTEDASRQLAAAAVDVSQLSRAYVDSASGAASSVLKSASEQWSDEQTIDAKTSLTTSIASYLNRFGGGGSPSCSRVPIGYMKVDPFTIVCEFLSPADLCILQQSCRFANDVISDPYLSDMMWKRYCIAHFEVGLLDIASEQGSSDVTNMSLPPLVPTYKKLYLQLFMQELVLLERQLSSTLRVRLGIQQFGKRFPPSDIIGVLCDLVWMNGSKIARAVSKARYNAMGTIITRTEQTISQFKQVNTMLGPGSFLPYETSQRRPLDMSTLPLFGLSASELPEGFIGYAVNLLQMRPEHEYLRFTVFGVIFYNLMVFTTRDAANRYASTVEVQQIQGLWTVALDDYSDAELDAVFPRLLTSPRVLDDFLLDRIHTKQSDLYSLHSIAESLTSIFSDEDGPEPLMEITPRLQSLIKSLNSSILSF